MLVNENNYEEAVSCVSEDGEIICDTETNGLEWARGSQIVGIGLLNKNNSFYFPFRHEEGRNLPENKIKDLISRTLPPERKQVGFHYGFDIKMLHKEGHQIPHKIEDAILAAHLVNENEPSFKMEELAERYIDDNAGAEEEELINYLQERFGGSKKRAKANLCKAPASAVYQYAERDLWTTRALRDYYDPILKREHTWDLAQEVYEYQLAIVEMEMAGILLDFERINEYSEEAKREAKVLEEAMQQSAGYAINPRSSKQVCQWLGVESSRREILEKLEENGDERAFILNAYRQWAKVNNTYYNKFHELATSRGFLHPNLRLTGTVAGRLSCSNPNLQAIPRGNDIYKVKNVFRASPGFTLVEADYSQAEIRVATHYAKEEKMREFILAGVDLHGAVAKERDMPRDIAKRLNFSVIYGIGAKKFSETYGIPYSQARKYLEDYHDTFPGFRKLYNKADYMGTQRGYIRLYTGRLRHFNAGWRSPTHKASSNLIQGSVAEMCRIAICRLRREVPLAKQLLTVHDSILFEIPTNHLEEKIPEIRRIMEDQQWCSIPMKVDIKTGQYWGECKEWQQ